MKPLNYEFAQLEFVEIDSSFGLVKAYFDNAVIQSNATVQIDASFSGVELYIPKSWKVVNQIETSFAGVDEKNQSESSGMPVLTIMGEASFSGVTIMYI